MLIRLSSLNRFRTAITVAMFSLLVISGSVIAQSGSPVPNTDAQAQKDIAPSTSEVKALKQGVPDVHEPEFETGSSDSNEVAIPEVDKQAPPKPAKEVPSEQQKEFKPSEEIIEDQAVSFPVDI